jgi:hypothetical protein
MPAGPTPTPPARSCGFAATSQTHSRCRDNGHYGRRRCEDHTETNAGQAPADPTHLSFAGLAHRRVIDVPVDPTVDLKDLPSV